MRWYLVFAPYNNKEIMELYKMYKAVFFLMQTEIHTSHLCISTKTDKYFPKADEFMPERWLRNYQGEMSYKRVHPFVTMPFGFGVRSCVGKRFAVLEMEILVAKVKLKSCVF